MGAPRHHSPINQRICTRSLIPPHALLPMRKTLLLAFTGLLLPVLPMPQAAAQHNHETWTPESGLERVFSDMFVHFLAERLNLGEGFHASHFFPAADVAQTTLAPALGNLISSNVASFPLSATQVGIVLDFSTGVPVKVIDRQGPIFAETGQTLGRNTFSAGVNYTHLNLSHFRGTALSDLTFAFTHEDFAGPGSDGIVGDEITERDIVYIQPHLELTAGIFAFYASYGILDNLDISLALPIVTLSAGGVAEAHIDSWTLDNTGRARHFLGGTDENPVLEASYRYEETETSLHSIGVRGKYQFPFQQFDAAALLDIRIPTGSRSRLLGSGATSWNLGIVSSGDLGFLNPHFNLLYNGRGSGYGSDRLTYAIGFDRRLVPGVSVAVDILGNFALNHDETIRLYNLANGPSTPVYYEFPGTPVTVPLSNIDDRDHDNTMNLSAGSRIAFSPEIQAMVNVMVPIRDGGLYARWVPTAGLTVIL